MLFRSRLAQYFLTVINTFYNEVPAVETTGYCGELTLNSVYAFQKLFKLSIDGIIGPLTWKAMYDTFLGICNTTGLVVAYPGYLLKVGSTGDPVWLMQSYLQKISYSYNIAYISADGIFGNLTKNAVIQFQNLFNLIADGIVGPATWEMIMLVRLSLK